MGSEAEEMERQKQMLAKRMRALEEESARLKAAALEEAERRKAEEVEVLLEKQKLEEALARVQAHSFRSVHSFTSPRTENSIVQATIMTPISYMGVAAAAFSSVYSTRPQFVQTPTYFCHSWLTVNE